MKAALQTNNGAKENSYMMYGVILIIILITSHNIKTTQGNNYPNRKQFEEDEFHRLEKKWSALAGTHTDNETRDLIPQDWLLPAKSHNVTFNSSLTQTKVAQNLVAQIQKHSIQNGSEKRDEVSRDSVPIRKAMQRAMAISLQDKVGDISKKMSHKFKNKNNKTELESTEDTLSEYPGKNQTARHYLFELWTKYYQCLQSNSDFTPKVHYIFPGESIK